MSVPVSVGEFVDKLSVLTIKLEKIADTEKRSSLEQELNELLPHYHEDFEEGLERLLEINRKLWVFLEYQHKLITDDQLDGVYISTALEIYDLNLKRYNVKKRLNEKFESYLSEVKSYA